jgi:hypothetical protein
MAGTEVGYLALLPVICWNRVRRDSAKVEWRFSTRVLAFMMSSPRGSTDPAHRSLSRSQQTTATTYTLGADYPLLEEARG